MRAIAVPAQTAIHYSLHDNLHDIRTAIFILLLNFWVFYAII